MQRGETPTALADTMASQEKVRAIEEAFALLDSDKTGFVTFDEFLKLRETTAWSDAMASKTWTDEDMRRLFEAMDTNNNGRIRYAELLQKLGVEAVAQRRTATEAQAGYGSAAPVDSTSTAHVAQDGAKTSAEHEHERRYRERKRKRMCPLAA